MGMIGRVTWNTAWMCDYCGKEEHTIGAHTETMAGAETYVHFMMPYGWSIDSKRRCLCYECTTHAIWFGDIEVPTVVPTGSR